MGLTRDSDDESEKSKDSKLHDSTLYKRKINKISEWKEQV